MSPMPTPEYEQHLQDCLRQGRRVDEQAPARSRHARSTSSGRVPLPDPRLLNPVGPATLEAMKAHRNWALRFAPWLVEDGLDD